MDVGGRDECVYATVRGGPNFGLALGDVGDSCTGQPADGRPIRLPHFTSYCMHSVAISRGGRRKARLDNINPETGQLARDGQLFRKRHRAPSRLFAITQGGIEDEDAVRTVGSARRSDSVGHGWPSACGTAI